MKPTPRIGSPGGTCPHSTGVRVKRGLLWCVPWALVAGTFPVQAERGYVTDACSIPVQSGAAPGYKIVRMVGSGTPLEILEPNAKGYTKIKTPQGMVGWIMTQYLMDQPSARDRVGPLEARVAALEDQNRILRGETETLNATREAAARCGEELTAIRRTASQTLSIAEENHRLQQEITAARERHRELELENTSLRDQSHLNWFIVGAGAVLGGLLCGLVLPRLSWPRRRRRWEQF